MAITTSGSVLTLEEFLALPECAPDGSHYELSEGELVILSPSGYRHGVVVANIVHLLRSQLDRSRFVVTTGETGFLLNTTGQAATVRGADVAVTDRSTPIFSGLFPGAPLVAIEVVSPSNTAEDLEKKTEQYLAAGTLDVWIVYPETRRVHLYSAMRPGPLVLAEGQVLESGKLNGAFPVAGFFEL